MGRVKMRENEYFFPKDQWDDTRRSNIMFHQTIRRKEKEYGTEMNVERNSGQKLPKLGESYTFTDPECYLSRYYTHIHIQMQCITANASKGRTRKMNKDINITV